MPVTLRARFWTIPTWFQAIFPVALIFLLPMFILQIRHTAGLVPEYDLGSIRYIGLLGMPTGVAIWGWAARILLTLIHPASASEGEAGAPAPLVHTDIFRGPYRFTRTPLYAGALLSLASEALFFQSVTLLLLTAGAFVLFHLYAILREEPLLRTKYQTLHQQYCLAVPRWFPRIVAKPFGLAPYDF